MPLFDFEEENKSVSQSLAPLADRIRPSSLDEMVGQEHLIGEHSVLRKMIKRDMLSSFIFFGPPGIGKSTLANIITKSTKSAYISINAVLSNVGEIRNSIKTGEQNIKRGKKTILFIDEIHRFNKSQQDALLPAIENGSIVLIGSTTQNPYFYLTNALLSRVTLFEFKELTENDIKKALLNAIKSEKGLGIYNVNINEASINLIVKSALGDVRKALTYLELAYLSVELDDSKDIPAITEETVKDVVQKQGLKYDGTGDEHYDIISAFIKSVRGSDSNAALYWLARMLESGEDPRFIARRLSILAAEDIGLAEPNALNIVSSMINIIDFIGMPEALIVLGEVTVYLSLCPKSNSAYMAIKNAIDDVRNGEILSVPNYLRDTHSSAFDKKDSASYMYAHDFPYHIAKQDYLPNGIKKEYYKAGELGGEKLLKQRYEWVKKHIFGISESQ